MSETYLTLQTVLLAELVKAQPPYDVVPPDFATIYPEAIQYAEQRIVTDIPLLATRQENTSLSTTGGVRSLDLSTMTNPDGGPIIVPEAFALLTASGYATFVAASLDVIDEFWPNTALTAAPGVTLFQPRYWALLDDHTLVMCPTPDDVYPSRITGLFRPTPLSAANPTTYLLTVYPALFEAACMVWLTGALLHNFGAQSENPQRAISWEGTYQSLLGPARAEERRRRGLSPDTPMPPQAPPGAA